jgi:hypothetical protein
MSIRRKASGERIRMVAGGSAGPSLEPSYASIPIGRSEPNCSRTTAATFADIDPHLLQSVVIVALDFRAG